jgi:hypothetical protein
MAFAFRRPAFHMVSGSYGFDPTPIVVTRNRTAFEKAGVPIVDPFAR